MNKDIVTAQVDLRQLEDLRKEEESLLSEFVFLPVKYDETKVNAKIDSLDRIIKEMQPQIKKAQSEVEGGVTDSSFLASLDKAIAEMEELIKEQETFTKYRDINNQKENLLIEIACKLANAKNIWYKDIFANRDTRDDLNPNIKEFINVKCLANSKIKQPFMVALLTHDADEIYEEIIKSTDGLSPTQQKAIRRYIELQKRRVASNLVLSDTALINLLETNTGKNIYLQTRANSRKEDLQNSYRRLANRLCERVYNVSKLTACLTTNRAEQVINWFEYLAKEGRLPQYQNLTSLQREQLAKHIMMTEADLCGEIKKENFLYPGVFKRNLKSKEYTIGSHYDNKYSLDGEKIKRFQDGTDFLRTIDDMQIASYPTSMLEKLIGESFTSSKVPRDAKRQIIAVLLENLQLCYDMFTSYYMRGERELKTYVVLTNDVNRRIELNQPLNSKNIPHLLGIPASRNMTTGNPNLPRMTMAFLGLDPEKFYPAIEVLEKLLENKERIVENSICGCLRDSDGVLYEMLPWEKIILKTNAFIRGDFFKNTSIFAALNPDSYMMRSDDKINTVAINSTTFNKDALYQKVPDRNHKFGNNDIILKGMIADLSLERESLRHGEAHQKIYKINGVVTNESFIGERLRTTDNKPLPTLNKVRYLLSDLDTESGGEVLSVESESGLISVKPLDENIALLEDMVLSFGDVDKVVELSHLIIDQLNDIYAPKKDLGESKTPDLGQNLDNPHTLRRKM